MQRLNGAVSDAAAVRTDPLFRAVLICAAAEGWVGKRLGTAATESIYGGGTDDAGGAVGKSDIELPVEETVQNPTLAM